MLANVSLLEADRLAPGEAAVAQLFLSEPVVTTWNQPLVLRSESPMITIAGGRVLVPAATKLRHASAVAHRCLQGLQSADPLSRAAAAIYFAETGCDGPDALIRTAGIEEPARVFPVLLQQGQVVDLSVSGQRKNYLHIERLKEYADRILKHLEYLHQQHPLKNVFDRVSLAPRFAN